MARIELKVIEARDETPTIRTVKLGLDGSEFAFKPGNYALFYLRLADGSEASHAFSIARSPGAGDYLQFATRKSESAFKQAFWQLREGMTVGVRGPLGKFFYEDSTEHAVMLSGGIGITPLKSMIEYAAARQPGNRITLLFSNSSVQEIPFRKELDEIAAGNPDIKIVYTVSSLQPGEQWGGKTGRINEAMIREFVPDLGAATYLICGPPGMVAGLTQTLGQMGVPSERIRIENFAGYE